MCGVDTGIVLYLSLSGKKKKVPTWANSNTSHRTRQELEARETEVKHKRKPKAGRARKEEGKKGWATKKKKKSNWRKQKGERECGMKVERRRAEF